jgi:hypothetical protein
LIITKNGHVFRPWPVNGWLPCSIWLCHDGPVSD